MLTFGGLAVACGALASRWSPVWRAAAYGTAAAVVWALEATFIKAMTDTLTANGVLGTLERWPLYAVIAGGVSGALLTQAALHVGPLAVSQPLMVAVDPLVSTVLGVWVFGEHFTNDPAAVSLGCIAFVSMAVGIVLLARFSPPTPTASPARVAAPPTRVPTLEQERGAT